MLFYKTPTTDQPKIQVHLCATVVSCPLTNPQLSFLSQQNLNKMSHFRTKRSGNYLEKDARVLNKGQSWAFSFLLFQVDASHKKEPQKITREVT